MAEKPFGLWSATASESISVKFDTGIALDEFFENNTLKVTDQAEHDRKLAKLREVSHERKAKTDNQALISELEEAERRVEELEKELKIHRRYLDILSAFPGVQNWI